MRETEFYICEEDNVFDELSALYEELKPSPYADAPGLDLSLEYDGVEEYFGALSEAVMTIPNEQDYSINPLDIYPGDIVLASPYQEGVGRNPDHQTRPFLVLYANAYMAYGFQLTTSNPISLTDYLVELPDWQTAGLIRPSKVVVNLVRGVRQQYLHAYIGHITYSQRQALLDKFYEIRDNLDGRYTDCWSDINRINMTIENIWRIRC